MVYLFVFWRSMYHLGTIRPYNEIFCKIILNYMRCAQLILYLTWTDKVCFIDFVTLFGNLFRLNFRIEKNYKFYLMWLILILRFFLSSKYGCCYLPDTFTIFIIYIFNIGFLHTFGFDRSIIVLTLYALYTFWFDILLCKW